MSDRVQDLTNHRKVAVACKNYTDTQIRKSEEKILSLVARNNIDFIDHTDEATYQVTVPQNAKLMMLQKIGGNTVKLSPTVASDSTKAMIKTMPSTVYTFNGDKFYGDSRISENLYISTDVAQTTVGGITYKIENGVLTLISGTANDEVYGVVRIILNTPSDYVNSQFTVSLFNDFTDTNISYCQRRNTSWGTWIACNVLNANYTFNSNPNINTHCIQIANGTTVNNYKIKLMIVKGSTAPSEFKVGFDNIHNIELTGLKVEGANLCKVEQGDFTYRSTTTTIGSDGLISFVVTEASYPQKYVSLEAGTYTVKWFSKSNTGSISFALYINSSEWTDYSKSMSVATTNSISFTISKKQNVKLLFGQNSGGINQSGYLMIVKGSIAPTSFEPYVSTNKTIDLTAIVDSNNNKLFPNGELMGNDNVKDVLGVYNQESAWDKADLGSLNWTLNSTYPNVFNCNDLTSLIKAGALDVYANVLIANYSVSTSGTVGDIDMSVAVGGTSILYIHDNRYSTAEDFKTAMNGVILNYERATHLTSNTDLSATLRNIQGYPNGSIIAENTHNMEVESVITYNSIIQETLCPSVSVDGYNRISPDNTFTYTGYGDLGYFECVGGETYTIRTFGVYTGSHSIFIYDGTSWSSLTSHNLSNGYTLTAPSNATRIGFNGCFANNGMAVNGSTIPTSYRPYKPSITRNLPTQASDGWSAGTQRNYRVFCDDEGNEVLKRETNVNKGDMGTPTWNYNSTAQQFSTSVINDLKLGNWQVAGNILCKPYTTIAGTNLSSNDMCIALNDSTQNIFAKDSKYTDGATFKLANTNEPLYYELADTGKTETDIDDFDYFFDVEEGDIITFNNTYAQQVYATYSFLIKEEKSNE